MPNERIDALRKDCEDALALQRFVCYAKACGMHLPDYEDNRIAHELSEEQRMFFLFHERQLDPLFYAICDVVGAEK